MQGHNLIQFAIRRQSVWKHLAGSEENYYFFEFEKEKKKFYDGSKSVFTAANVLANDLPSVGLKEGKGGNVAEKCD